MMEEKLCCALTAFLFLTIRCSSVADYVASIPKPPYVPLQGTQTYYFPGGGYNIPGNVDVNQLPVEATAVFLGGYKTCMPPPTNNYIHDNVVPLPAHLTKLFMLAICHYQGTNGTRLPIEKFVVNAKKTLRYLSLHRCRIRQLRSGFLRGFDKLSGLVLVSNDILTIEVGAFESLPTLQGSRAPVSWISLSDNKFTTLDWAVFAPVADTLKLLSRLLAKFSGLKWTLADTLPVPRLQEFEGQWTEQGFAYHENRNSRCMSKGYSRGTGVWRLYFQELWLANTPLATLTLSEKFKFATLNKLSMEYNKLTFPLRDVLDTLTIRNVTAYTAINFSSNAFCPHENEQYVPVSKTIVRGQCACCEAEDFIQWTHAVVAGFAGAKPNLTLSFSCGGTMEGSKWIISNEGVTLPLVDQYQHCRNGSTVYPHTISQTGYYKSSTTPSTLKPHLNASPTPSGTACSSSYSVLLLSVVFAALVF